MPPFDDIWHREAENQGRGGRVYIIREGLTGRGQRVLYNTSVFYFYDFVFGVLADWWILLILLV